MPFMKHFGRSGTDSGYLVISGSPTYLRGMGPLIPGLLSGHPRGAEASANLYSLIETAKANGLEPYRYLRFLFEKLPYAKTEDDYRALLPQNINATDLANITNLL